MDDWTAVEWIFVIVIGLGIFLAAFFNREKIKNMVRGGGKSGDKNKKQY